MTVIRPNSISGITSLTAHRGSIDFYAHDGSAATFNNINSNVTSGVSTFASLNITGDLDVGGALTYEDVTNIDSVGVITARAGIDVTGGTVIQVGSGSISNPALTLSGTAPSDTLVTTSTGKIGFGTDNPLNRLDILQSDGRTRVTSFGHIITQNRIHGTTNYWSIAPRNGGELDIAYGSPDGNGTITGDKLTITTDGKFGIGTNNPSNFLHVKNDTNASNYITAENTTAGNAGVRLKNSQGDYAIFANDDLIFYDLENDVERLRIESGGFVGLGTDNPYHELHIQGSSDTRVLITSGGTGDAVMMFENASGNTWGHGIDLTNNNYVIAYNNTSDPSLTADGILNITSTGKVLINSTANSDAQLLVKSADKLHPALKMDGLSANGFSLLGDEYNTDESNFTMGIAYSSASLVTGWGVKVSPTASNEYLSSQDTYSTKHSAVRHDGDGWKFLSNSSSQTVTTDSVVSLTERIRISSDGKILKGMTSSLLGSSDVQLTGSGGPAKIAGYWSNNNPNANNSMLTVTGYSQSGSTFTGIGEIDFRVEQSSNTASGYHPGSIVTRVNGGNQSGTWGGQTYSFAGLKDRERITFKSKRYYCLPEIAGGSDTYNTFREEWDYQHHVGYNRYSWYRFTSHSSSSSRGGSVDIRVTWSSRHAGGAGYGHWGFHWRDSHSNGYMEIGNVYKYHSSYLGGTYYGWNSNPNLHVYEINDSGNNAGFYLRVQGHIDANGSTYDGGVIHQFLISAHTNRYGADVNKFEFVGNSTPSDVGSQQNNINIP